MSNTYRKERLDELLLRELSSIVDYELQDPRLLDVSISRVDVTRDLATARIYVAPFDQDADKRAILKALDKASGFVRSQLASRIQMRRMPDLVFKIDLSQHYSQRVDAILETLPPPAPLDDVEPATGQTEI